VCKIKAAFVLADEREDNSRRLLHFGHTVGHALEQVVGIRCITAKRLLMDYLLFIALRQV
jgi:3-dehydroquinate synthetase